MVKFSWSPARLSRTVDVNKLGSFLEVSTPRPHWDPSSESGISAFGRPEDWHHLNVLKLWSKLRLKNTGISLLSSLDWHIVSKNTSSPVLSVHRLIKVCVTQHSAFFLRPSALILVERMLAVQNSTAVYGQSLHAVSCNPRLRFSVEDSILRE